MFKRILSSTVIICFSLTSFGPIPQAHADALNLPAPGSMVNLSPAYQPVMIKGLTVHKDNPFLFDFIVDVGQDHMAGEPLKKEGTKLIKYFLASLAIPDKDVWVNLSPYEKNRMIPEALGQTDMGRDLLEQDYILKQITASLIYPEKQLGQEFWSKVYAKAQEQYGRTQIPVNTFNKVWIMADRAEVFEHNQTAFVVDQHLKVMLEEDYLALQKHIKTNDTHSISSQIIKQIVLPELEKEVNTGKNFANLRQIFNSIILSSWYKRNLKQALLNQVYANQSKVNGIDLNDPTIKDKIYEQYLQAYKKGVFNYIKEDVNVANGQAMPRKYFSGGMREGASSEENVKVTTDMSMGAKKMSEQPWDGEVDITALASMRKSDAAMSAKAIIDTPSAISSFSSAMLKIRIINTIQFLGGYRNVSNGTGIKEVLKQDKKSGHIIFDRLNRETLSSILQTLEKQAAAMLHQTSEIEGKPRSRKSPIFPWYNIPGREGSRDAAIMSTEDIKQEFTAFFGDMVDANINVQPDKVGTWVVIKQRSGVAPNSLINFLGEKGGQLIKNFNDRGFALTIIQEDKDSIAFKVGELLGPSLDWVGFLNVGDQEKRREVLTHLSYAINENKHSLFNQKQISALKKFLETGDVINRNEAILYLSIGGYSSYGSLVDFLQTGQSAEREKAMHLLYQDGFDSMSNYGTALGMLSDFLGTCPTSVKDAAMTASLESRVDVAMFSSTANAISFETVMKVDEIKSKFISLFGEMIDGDVRLQEDKMGMWVILRQNARLKAHSLLGLVEEKKEQLIKIFNNQNYVVALVGESKDDVYFKISKFINPQLDWASFLDEGDQRKRENVLTYLSYAVREYKHDPFIQRQITALEEFLDSGDVVKRNEAILYLSIGDNLSYKSLADFLRTGRDEDNKEAIRALFNEGFDGVSNYQKALGLLADFLGTCPVSVNDAAMTVQVQMRKIEGADLNVIGAGGTKINIKSKSRFMGAAAKPGEDVYVNNASLQIKKAFRPDNNFGVSGSFLVTSRLPKASSEVTNVVPVEDILPAIDIYYLNGRMEKLDVEEIEKAVTVKKSVTKTPPDIILDKDGNIAIGGGNVLIDLNKLQEPYLTLLKPWNPQGVELKSGEFSSFEVARNGRAIEYEADIGAEKISFSYVGNWKIRRGMGMLVNIKTVGYEDPVTIPIRQLFNIIATEHVDGKLTIKLVGTHSSTVKFKDVAMAGEEEKRSLNNVLIVVDPHADKFKLAESVKARFPQARVITVESIKEAQVVLRDRDFEAVIATNFIISWAGRWQNADDTVVGLADAVRNSPSHPLLIIYKKRPSLDEPSSIVVKQFFTNPEITTQENPEDYSGLIRTLERYFDTAMVSIEEIQIRNPGAVSDLTVAGRIHEFAKVDFSSNLVMEEQRTDLFAGIVGNRMYGPQAQRAVLEELRMPGFDKGTAAGQAQLIFWWNTKIVPAIAKGMLIKNVRVVIAAKKAAARFRSFGEQWPESSGSLTLTMIMQWSIKSLDDLKLAKPNFSDGEIDSMFHKLQGRLTPAARQIGEIIGDDIDNPMRNFRIVFEQGIDKPIRVAPEEVGLFQLLGSSNLRWEEAVIMNREEFKRFINLLPHYLAVGLKAMADTALAARIFPVVDLTHGGIDLNTSNGMTWKISKDGKGVEMTIDPAMIARIQHEGINWLSPVILKITPVTDVWSLAGLHAPAANTYSA